MAGTAGSTRAPRLKKKLPVVTGIFRLQPRRLSMRWLPAVIPGSGFQRTAARRQLPRLLRRERLRASALYRPDSPPRLHSILRNCHPSNAPRHLTRATRSWTRNTGTSRKIRSRSRTRIGRSSSRIRTRNISSWQNSRLLKEERSKWSNKHQQQTHQLQQKHTQQIQQIQQPSGRRGSRGGDPRR